MKTPPWIVCCLTAEFSRQALVASQLFFEPSPTSFCTARAFRNGAIIWAMHLLLLLLLFAGNANDYCACITRVWVKLIDFDSGCGNRAENGNRKFDMLHRREPSETSNYNIYIYICSIISCKRTSPTLHDVQKRCFFPPFLASPFQYYEIPLELFSLAKRKKKQDGKRKIFNKTKTPTT